MENPAAHRLLSHMDRVEYEEPSLMLLFEPDEQATEIVQIFTALRDMGKDDAWEAINNIAEKIERMATQE